MVPVVFVNCSLFPFVAWIMAGAKLFETRNRNTLRALIGQRVYIAVTGRGRPPVIMCAATLAGAYCCKSADAWRFLRAYTQVPAGSAYDWTDATRRKWLYRLIDVQPVEPFTPPEGIRHGRVWMEYHPVQN